ncbi:hypothetical protein BGZ96_011314 [Linnemannia gamsii]|uniref:Uncharacterized protein n=1 Tax=Linnemannia gamsii TaxID=64522 RepID=A0ABQ7JSH5_9FUNG|nr:hypothetical protein BGZ96_011314 [Linnemannia gamsii]
MFLLSRWASRNYNLTHQERINGGFLNGVKYVLLGKFPSGRKQYLGRFYVVLALIVSNALNYLPTLLSDIYPVQPAFLETNTRELDISAAFAKTTGLRPNHTSAEDILFAMGIPLNGSIVHSYTASVPPPASCRFHTLLLVSCGNIDPFNIGNFYLANHSLAAVNSGGDGVDMPLKGTTSGGTQFEYFNTTEAADEYSLVRMFLGVGTVSNSLYTIDDMTHPSPRSLEGCLTKGQISYQCVRHSVGYMISSQKHVATIKRRVFTQTIAVTVPQNLTNSPPYFPAVIENAKLDCARLPTPTLQTMCRQLNGLGSPTPFRMLTTQKQTIDLDATFHYDVVTLHLAYNFQTRKISITAEAFHLDISITYYNTTYDDPKMFEASSNDEKTLRQLFGRETFEATNAWNTSAYSLYDHTWIDWGFSLEDVHNLTNFLLGGTMINSGNIVLLDPRLLANVSIIGVALFFAVAFVMIGVGFLVSTNVHGSMHDPLTEVLPKVLESMNSESSSGASNFCPPRIPRYRVANLTLVSQSGKDEDDDDVENVVQAAAAVNATAFSSAVDYNHPHQLRQQPSQVDSVGTTLTSTRRCHKTLLIRMELDTDDEINAIELVEHSSGGGMADGSESHQPSRSSASLLGHYNISSSSIPPRPSPAFLINNPYADNE